MEEQARKYITPDRTDPINLGAINFGEPAVVADMVKELHGNMFPGASNDYIDAFFTQVKSMFAGNVPGFQAMDMAYHDLVHTMQATMCLVTLLHNRHMVRAAPVIGADDFRKALIAILLHDIGFLKEVGDNDGTGAKYTHIHEKRSCHHARSYLSRLGWSEREIRSVETLISCTGPRGDLTKILFQDDTERLLGQSVCTADYIGQMSDPSYVDKLGVLFKEFEENFRYQEIPEQEWPFKSYEDLLKGTPAFWEKYVTWKMLNECGGVWKYLEYPGTSEDPYLSAVRQNIERVRYRIASMESEH